MNNLKDTIQKNFDQEKNYNIILSKMERRDNMKVKLSYVLASSFIAIALLVGVVAYNMPENNNEIVTPPTVPGVLEININKAEKQGMAKLDADIQFLVILLLLRLYTFLLPHLLRFLAFLVLHYLVLYYQYF